MEKTVYDLNTKIRQRKIHDTYSMSEFAINLEGMIDEGTYKTTIQNMHNIVWKAKFLKSNDFSMLGHGCGVFQYP